MNSEMKDWLTESTPTKLTNYSFYKEELIKASLVGMKVSLNGEIITVTEEWLNSECKEADLTDIFTSLFNSFDKSS